MRTIRFARIRFEPKLPHFTDGRDELERRKEALREVIHFDTDINSLLLGTPLEDKIKKGEWRFGGIQDEGDYIAGRLGKYKTGTGRRPDENVRDFVKYEQEDTDVTFFVIDLETSVMAYEYRRDVGKKAPYRIIETVFNEFHGGEEEISFIPLTDKEEIRKELQRFAKITRFRFTNLHPTNPDSTDRSRPMDQFLQNANIDSLIMDGQNYDEEGEINLEGTELLDGGLALAEEGYGTARITGEDARGGTVHVSTDEVPIEIEIAMGDTDEINRRRLLNEIRQALNRLDD